MVRFSHSSTIEIEAPPDRVFAAMTRPEEIRAWMPGLVALESLTSGETGVGSQWKETRKLMGHHASEVFEVSEYEAPRRLGLRVDGSKGSSRKGEYLFTYDLEPAAGGTRLTMNGEISMPGGWMTRFIGNLFRGMFKKMHEKDLAALKAHAEGRPKTGP